VLWESKGGGSTANPRATNKDKKKTHQELEGLFIIALIMGGRIAASHDFCLLYS
jgi:hypothetical protein